MNMEIFTSNRYFTVFDYLVSHGQLLIRSDKRKGYASNIDIIFFDTQFIQLFTMLNGIKISIINTPQSHQYPTVSKYLSYDNNHLFEVESEGIIYYIAASFVKVFENNLEFNETSLGFDQKGRQRELFSSI